MKQLLSILILMVASFSSCDDPFSSNFESIDTVTGLSLFDINGAPVGLWGIPNDNRNAGQVFPNPSSGLINVYSADTLTRIWIVKANCNKSNDDDITANSLDLNYDNEQLDEASVTNGIFEVEGLQNSFDFSQNDKGFFRVFYRSKDGTLGWQNIFIDPNLEAGVDANFLDDEC